MFVGTLIYINACCGVYRTFYIYACYWILSYYTTLFISWIFIWVLTSLYTLQICAIYLTRFKEFRILCIWSSVDILVKVTDNFWKVLGIIDQFNESCRQISSGVEKRHMSRWVPYNFVPPLKYIYIKYLFFRNQEPL